MPFLITESNVPAAIGAGGGQVVDHAEFTHRLVLSDGNRGKDKRVAIVLATFDDGPEFDALVAWARQAHRLTDVQVEHYDAAAEAEERQAQAAHEAAQLAEASKTAKAIVADAKAEAARIRKEAEAAPAGILAAAKAEAAKILDEARAEAKQIKKDAKAPPASAG